MMKKIFENQTDDIFTATNPDTLLDIQFNIIIMTTSTAHSLEACFRDERDREVPSSGVLI